MTISVLSQSPSPQLSPQKCPAFKNCYSCSSQPHCVWCNGYNKCLTGTNLGSASTLCYNNGGGSLVLTGYGCSSCK